MSINNYLKYLASSFKHKSELATSLNRSNSKIILKEWAQL